MIELRKRLPTDYKDRPRLLSTPTVKIVPSYQQQQNKPKLLDQLRDALRSRHYSRRGSLQRANGTGPKLSMPLELAKALNKRHNDERDNCYKQYPVVKQ